MAKKASRKSVKRNDELDHKKWKWEYERAISLMEYHTQLLWTEFSAFLVAQTVLIGFLGTVTTQAKAGRSDSLPMVFLGSIFGLLLCILWLATFQHNYQYYLLRMAQAKRIEPKLEISLLSEGQILSSGNPVIVGDKKLRFSVLARCLPPKRSVSMLIVLFGVVFIILAVYARPGW